MRRFLSGLIELRLNVFADQFFPMFLTSSRSNAAVLLSAVRLLNDASLSNSASGGVFSCVMRNLKWLKLACGPIPTERSLPLIQDHLGALRLQTRQYRSAGVC